MQSPRPTLSSILLAVSFLFGSTWAAERDVPVRLVTLPSVSKGFVAESEEAISSVPKHVWDGVKQAGWEVHLAEFVVDVRPNLKKSRPRGWPASMTWNNSDAMNDAANRRVVVAEKRVTRDGRIVPNRRVAGVLRHELGHTFDRVLGGRSGFCSSTTGFVRAYQRDLSELSGSQRKLLGYYVQRRSAGRQEAFAEAFAVVLGGGSDGPQKAFRQNFPTVVKFVAKEVRDYRP